MSALPWIIAAILMALSLLHVGWGLGSSWPAPDLRSLARAVVGGPEGARVASAAACFCVALLLGVAALLVLAATSSVPLALPLPLVRLGAYVVMAAFLVRGAAGFFIQRLRPSPPGSPFVRLNLLVYSPLSLTLGVLIFFALQPRG